MGIFNQDKLEPKGVDDINQSLMNPSNPSNPENISNAESQANVVDGGHFYWNGKLIK